MLNSVSESVSQGPTATLPHCAEKDWPRAVPPASPESGGSPEGKEPRDRNRKAEPAEGRPRQKGREKERQTGNKMENQRPPPLADCPPPGPHRLRQDPQTPWGTVVPGGQPGHLCRGLSATARQPTKGAAEDSWPPGSGRRLQPRVSA